MSKAFLLEYGFTLRHGSDDPEDSERIDGQIIVHAETISLAVHKLKQHLIKKYGEEELAYFEYENHTLE
jgi:hypothetical protein